jgi:uncharacterized protein (DUF983 family)
MKKIKWLLDYNCPQCNEPTAYDEWAKPNFACINCGCGEE